ncbi:hypothetical protein [Anaeromyxobacter sp. PSR-1]|nr:hypothetical protein [Anaeromyxobacter sp. PSR-1]
MLHLQSVRPMVTSQAANATSRRRVALLCHFHFSSSSQVIFRFS